MAHDVDIEFHSDQHGCDSKEYDEDRKRRCPSGRTASVHRAKAAGKDNEAGTCDIEQGQYRVAAPELRHSVLDGHPGKVGPKERSRSQKRGKGGTSAVEALAPFGAEEYSEDGGQYWLPPEGRTKYPLLMKIQARKK